MSLDSKDPNFKDKLAIHNAIVVMMYYKWRMDMYEWLVKKDGPTALQGHPLNFPAVDPHQGFVSTIREYAPHLIAENKDMCVGELFKVAKMYVYGNEEGA